MADMTPSGKATIILPTIRQKVPTMAGKIPPPVIPSVGSEVRNSQLMEPAPCQMMKPRIQNRIATTIRPRIRKVQNAIA